MTVPHDQVTRLIAAYNAHDAAAIGSVIAPGGTQEDVPFGHVKTTVAEMVESLSPFFVSVPDAYWREDHRIVAGQSIVVTYTLTGHLRADLGHLKARGQPVICPGIFVLKFAEGKLVAAQDFWDPEAFGRQVA